MRKNLIWLALLVVATAIILSRRQHEAVFQTESGRVFGTFFTVNYRHPVSLRSDIDSVLRLVDFSLSPFNEASVISRINRNEPVVVDSLFLHVFRCSEQVSELTDGAFDITVAPLVNAYGFGFREARFPDAADVDSLLQITGYRHVSLDESTLTIRKDDPRIMLTCSAVAKGYAVDVVARQLSQCGVTDYMVDIGGEVVVKGLNPDGQPWRIGVNKPIDDSLSVRQDLQTVLHVSDMAMATSGNYRNFYYRGGRKYAHTVDPRTGLPVQHSLLSATVLAPDCMTADALATAFMVMGADDALHLADSLSRIEAYLICDDGNGGLTTLMTEGMKQYIRE